MASSRVEYEPKYTFVIVTGLSGSGITGVAGEILRKSGLCSLISSIEGIGGLIICFSVSIFSFCFSSSFCV